jgi:hypothetical protein
MVSKRQAFSAHESTQSAATIQLRSEVHLLKLLSKHKAPLALYPAIQQWACESASLKHDFTRNIRPHVTMMSELEDRFDMMSSRFKPTIVTYLPDQRPTLVYMVYIASFADAVYSLLSYPKLTKQDNLAFPDPKVPFVSEPIIGQLRPPPTTDMNELHYGTWYKATYKARCTQALDVLCPVIAYIDGVSTDANGRLGLLFHSTLHSAFIMLPPVHKRRPGSPSTTTQTMRPKQLSTRMLQLPSTTSNIFIGDWTPRL